MYVTGGLNVSTTMHIPDGSVGLQIGNSNDMRIYHDGTYNVIKGSSHTFFIENSGNISFTKVGLSLSLIHI